MFEGCADPKPLPRIVIAAPAHGTGQRDRRDAGIPDRDGRGRRRWLVERANQMVGFVEAAEVVQVVRVVVGHRLEPERVLVIRSAPGPTSLGLANGLEDIRQRVLRPSSGTGRQGRAARLAETARRVRHVRHVEAARSAAASSCALTGGDHRPGCYSQGVGRPEAAYSTTDGWRCGPFRARPACPRGPLHRARGRCSPGAPHRARARRWSGWPLRR